MKKTPCPIDAERAAAYWAGKPRRIYAVDIEAGPAKRPTFEATIYCRASSNLKAIECARRNCVHRSTGLRYRARLAGPRELGCQIPATQQQLQQSPTQGSAA
jgi:hypothetical protein